MLPSRTSEEGYLLLNGKPIAEIECTIIEEVPRIDWWGSFRVKEEYQDKLAELFLELGVSEGLEIDLASYDNSNSHQTQGWGIYSRNRPPNEERLVI